MQVIPSPPNTKKHRSRQLLLKLLKPDGVSPFGIMFMKDKTIIEDSSKTTTTEPVAKSPFPILGILAGLGAAAVFGLRMRR